MNVRKLVGLVGRASALALVACMATAPVRVMAGQLLVADSWDTPAGTAAGSVRSYDPATGAFGRVLIPAGSAGLQAPNRMIFAADGTLLVLDMQGDRILRYSRATGELLGTFVDGAGRGLRDLALGPDGRVYASTSVPSVDAFDPMTGADLGTVIGSGSLPGGAYRLAFGPDGDLWVYETGGIARFDGSTFARLYVAVPEGPAAPLLFLIFSMTFGPDGNLYVAGIENPVSPQPTKVLRYDGISAAPLGEFANLGGDSQTPYSLAFDTQGDLYVGWKAPGGPPPGEVVKIDGATGSVIGPMIPAGSGLEDPVAILFTPSAAAQMQQLLDIVDNADIAPAGVANSIRTKIERAMILCDEHRGQGDLTAAHLIHAMVNQVEGGIIGRHLPSADAVSLMCNGLHTELTLLGF